MEQYNQMKQVDIEQTALARQQLGEQSQEVEDPFRAEHPEDDIDLQLPNVIILLSDNVRLIRNNSVPMLQAQVEII